MEANGLQDAYIRYTVTAGEGLLGLPAGDYLKPSEILFAKERRPQTKCSTRKAEPCGDCPFRVTHRNHRFGLNLCII